MIIFSLCVSLCLPPSVTGEVYCFPRRQLIFNFGRRVIGIPFERSLRIYSEIVFFFSANVSGSMSSRNVVLKNLLTV